jgi:tetrahydromethanopterin S-methyltransferase subunit F
MKFRKTRTEKTKRTKQFEQNKIIPISKKRNNTKIKTEVSRTREKNQLRTRTVERKLLSDQNLS